MSSQHAEATSNWESILQREFPDLARSLAELRRESAQRRQRLSQAKNPLSIGVVG